MSHIFCIFLLLTFTKSKPEPQLTSLSNMNYSYLALGDSYTIGEQVSVAENFPNQVWKMMNDDSVHFQQPRIIATTGWTTDELEQGIKAANETEPLKTTYDFVSLLIGVNNQYRGRSVENYKPEFEELLKKAINYAGGKRERVVVLSIPDWGITPFANGRDREQIAREINAYNTANQQVAEQYHVHYINITSWTREAATDNSLLAADGLHPSAKEYKRWAEKMATYFQSRL